MRLNLSPEPLRAPPGHDNATLQRRMREGRAKDRAVGASPCSLEESEHNLGLVFHLSMAVCMVLADHAGIPFVPGEEARA